MGNSVTVKILIAFLGLASVTEFTVRGLRNVRVTVPSAVESGRNAVLSCEYDLESDTMYSVKWYKGRREFFRYTPKEIPSMKVFPLVGVFVDMYASNVTHLTLTNVSTILSAKYSCEVSADAPSFQTFIVSGEMDVIVPPSKLPQITGTKPYYQPGEVFQANCTSGGSMPAAQLEWKINKFPAYTTDTINYDIVKDAETKLETRTIGLHFLVSPVHFPKGKLQVQCIARIHDLYVGEQTKNVEEDRPPQVYSPSLSYLSEEDYNLRNGAASATAASATSSGTAMYQHSMVKIAFGAIKLIMNNLRKITGRSSEPFLHIYRFITSLKL